MNPYVDRLRGENSRKRASEVVQEQQEGASRPFCSTQVADIQKVSGGAPCSAGRATAPANEAGEHFRWRVQTADGWREVRFSPPADHARVKLHYGDAGAEPLPDEPGSVATPEQADELRRLVPVVCRLAGEDEVDHCLVRALADPEVALTSFRVLAADLPRLPLPCTDDRRTCRQCVNLSPGGRCLAAWRSEDFGDGIAVGREYAPGYPGRPQRCLAYMPGPRDRDRRRGRERWPLLATTTCSVEGSDGWAR